MGDNFGNDDDVWLVTATIVDRSVLPVNTDMINNFLTNTGVNPYLQVVTPAFLAAVPGFAESKLLYMVSTFTASIVNDTTGAELQDTASKLEGLCGQTLAVTWTPDTGVGTGLGMNDDAARRGFNLKNPLTFGGDNPNAEAGASFNIAATGDISINQPTRVTMQWNLYYYFKKKVA